MIDIWHTTKEKPMLHRDIILCGDGWSMAIDIIPETVNNICWKNVEKWCYLDDLIALEIELDRTRKALDYAINVIQTVAKMSDKLSREYGETLVEQLDNIQAYCWQEGYVLTHEEDLERAITALTKGGDNDSLSN